ncbi:MAG: D-alanyl-D-alanine carboxypeptidase family protein [Candidatus Daviesbacteria bacterium]
MKPVLLSLVILLLGINIVLGLPFVLNLVQTKVLAIESPGYIISSNQITPPPEIKKAPPIPQSLGLPKPSLSASSALVQDLDSGTLLLVKDASKKVPIASTTKIMTAWVATKYFKPNDVLKVPDLSGISGSTMGLKTGEELTFRSVLYGMLLNSGNDAAYTIAANFPGGISAFIAKMNQEAQNLNLADTHFDNPAGFDSNNHYSSAFDLAKIAAKASTDYQIARVVATKETTVASLDKTVIHQLKNLNKLLDEPGVMGIKTGTTPAAKENLVALIERDGHKILTVVLGSEDRFGETEKLVDWTYANFTWNSQQQQVQRP